MTLTSHAPADSTIGKGGVRGSRRSAEAATRFAISHSAMGTILVGVATPQQFEEALAAVQKGRLPSAALDRLSGLQHAFVGELR
jgi:aryl-alcohol dehydrogenase-like predicted oxidoreductase